MFYDIWIALSALRALIILEPILYLYILNIFVVYWFISKEYLELQDL